MADIIFVVIAINMRGWIALHRQFTQWEWFGEPEMVQLFIYLLLSATHEDTQWRGMAIKRGQIVTSLDKIRAATGLSTSKIRTSLERLKLTNEITSESTNKFRVITICNYDKYQGVTDASDKQVDKQIASKSQTNRKQIASSISYNNNNNNNNNNNKISLSSAQERTREQERERVFKIFVLKNFISPVDEVDRFFANYEAQGWRRANGQKITDVIAVAKGWQQAEVEKKRFPEPFIEALREIDEQFAARGWDSLEMLKGIDKIDFANDMLNIYCNSLAHQTIEQSGAAEVIRAKLNRQINYRVKRTN